MRGEKRVKQRHGSEGRALGGACKYGICIYIYRICKYKPIPSLGILEGQMLGTRGQR